MNLSEGFCASVTLYSLRTSTGKPQPVDRTPIMKPEQWQKIDQLFHATLEWPPPERPHFLNQACPDDEDLRGEVESLVLAHERDGEFLNAPVYEVSTEVFADVFAGLLAGQQIGPYKILSLL